jgi:copper chaperone CopZ
MSVLVRVVHTIPGRTRLRAEGIKGDVAALSAVQTALEDAKGVQNVHVNALTGSILVEHDTKLDDVLQQLQQRHVLELDNSEPEHYLATLHRALAESDRRLKVASKGKLDLETISFMGFVAGGIYQCFNNHGLPAGVTLLRYAVELATSTAIGTARSAIAKLPAAQQTEAVSFE